MHEFKMDKLAIELFQLVNDEIKISIEARFENQTLVVEGYDIGKRVEEYWGDSDYEYSATVIPAEVEKLYQLLAIPVGDRQGLLAELANRFNTNTCYSDFRNFLDEHEIKHEGFSWS